MPNVRRRPAWTRRLAGRVILLCAALLGLGRIALATLQSGLVDESRFAIPSDSYSVLDRHGRPLRHERPRSRGEAAPDRRWVRLEEIDRDLVDAVVAVEDHRFFEHQGVDPLATAHAVAAFVVPGMRLRGASTITQQLVKLVYGRPHGFGSKLLEIVRALELERRWSKAAILEQYLNRLPYAHGIEGVERAAEAYFGRSARELTLSEAALLAGLPQAPSRLDPRRHLARALARRDVVLTRMLALGLRSDAEVRAALAERPSLALDVPRAYRAPRFVDAVVREIRRGTLAPFEGRVRTSLDLELQREVEHLLRGTLSTFERRGASNAAAVVVRVATGEILAYVGAARSGAHAEAGQMDLLRARRQPGSTLKPFLYALWFERGGSPASIVDDLASPMTGRAGALYAAENYDGLERGPVSARLALGGSLNLAALDVARRLGPDRLVSGLASFGLATARPASELGAAVVLGGADVTALELAEAYVALARGGVRIPLRLTPLADTELRGRRVVSASAAALVRHVLSDPAVRRSAFGDDLVRFSGSDGDAGPPALKTGTSQGWRDAWAAVFDDDFVVVVWVGDPSGDSMDRVSGFEAAAPMAMRALGAARARWEELRSGPGLVRAADAGSDSEARHEVVYAHVCAHSGLRPSGRCSRVVREVFARGTVPERSCDVHAEDGTVLLPERYRGWLERAQPHGFRLLEGLDAPSLAPEVAYPRDGAVLLVPAGSRAQIPLRARVGSVPRADATFEVDGERLVGPAWTPRAGSHRLVAIVQGRRSAPVQVEVRTE